MVATRVPIATVEVDPACVAPHPGRVRYRVTLTCGCSWWEEHPADATPPQVGTLRNCYAAAHPQSENA